MTKEKTKTSKLKKEADKPDLKPLKNIKKHKSDKPPKPQSENFTLDSDAVQSTKTKKKKKHEPNSLNPENFDSKTPDLDSIQTTKMKKKHKAGEPSSLDPKKLDIETPDFDSVQSLKKKKHKSDETKSLNPEKLDIEAPDSDSVQSLKKKKKKKHKLDKPPKTQSLNPENIDVSIPDSDPIQTTKKKKKCKSDKPQFINPEEVDSTPEADSVQILKRKKKKQKSDKPQSPRPKIFESKSPDSGSIQPLQKKKKKKKSDNPQKLHSTEHFDSIQTQKKKSKQELDNPQSPNPEILDSQIETDSIRTSKKKKRKLDKPCPLNPEILDSEIDPDSIQTRKKKRKYDLDKPQSPSPQIETDPTRTPEKKKQKLDECQKSQSANPEILDSKIDSDSIQSLLEPHTKDQLIEFLLDSAVKTPSISSKIIETDSIRTSKGKKHKLDKPSRLNPEILDSEIDPDSIQTQKKKRKHDLDKPQSPNSQMLDSQIETDSIRTPEKKKEKLDECQKPQSVNPEILDSEIDTDSIQNLLEPHTKDQLIEFLLDSAVKTPSIFSKIIETADQDISHRRIFVHNLDWDTTREAVVSVFEQFGELETCDVVYDRATGKAKGFGFVIFKSRECARNALKEPKKRIHNRTVSCQWASIGPPVVGSVDNSCRKIYVSNVEKDVDSGKLREFFEKFGEIEVGPLGFDMQTGKSKGYALFVYKNLEGARKVLEEPNKIFDGKQLNCRMANDWNGRKKNSKSDSSVTTVMMPVPHDLSAVWPKQNMAMVGQQAGLNPMLGHLNSIPEGFYANPSAGLLNQLLCQASEGLYAHPSAGLLNQLLSQAAIEANQFGQMGVGLGAYGEAMTGQGMGSLAWNHPGLGSVSGSTSAPMLQGWQHAYSDT